ncbi:DUF4214 domain-containing protein [Acidithiobacillus montserratensis]|uniref:DUF4214 domain-containing protein n=1 Tax=Acidithiobacillus montserratensis TaxID=2729135 RepID=A0ACD5HHG6_9PROT|nr:DUF4214 domain-containing protein [Acidithiobacillus montserratensis]MBN2679349.1 DUF4214 domain-containing protein [Acidithiobacillaceae bacterium]MBU2747603.1 DUF4214 domain-containing protein [Acidithiobacillus montserratensis]
MPDITHITELFALDDSEFVTEAYRNLLQHDPDTQGMAYYLGRLAQGFSKESVIFQLAKSPECRPHKEITGLETLVRGQQRDQHWLWRRVDGSVREKEINQLRLRLEIERKQAQNREDTLRQETEREQERLESVANAKIEALQDQLVAAQQELLTRERVLNEQIAALHKKELERVEQVQRDIAARDVQVKQELDLLRQQLHGEREAAQQREQALRQAAEQEYRLLQSELTVQLEQVQEQLIMMQQALESRPESLPLTDELIRQAYQAVLRRDPENQEIIEEKRSLGHFVALYQDLLSSEEYRLLNEQPSVKPLPVTPEAVRQAYLSVLGREPEDDQVISNCLQQESLLVLYQSLLSSEEYQRRVEQAATSINPLTSEIIRQAYLAVLGREPENEDVIHDQLQLASADMLYQNLLSSEEYRLKINEL